MRVLNERQVISPQADEGLGEGTPGALCSAQGREHVAGQAWMDIRHNGKLPP